MAFDGITFYKNKRNIWQYKAVSTPDVPVGRFDNQTPGLATLFTTE